MLISWFANPPIYTNRVSCLRWSIIYVLSRARNIIIGRVIRESASPCTHIRTHARTHIFVSHTHTHTHAYIYIHEFGTYYAVKYVHVNLYTSRGWSALERRSDITDRRSDRTHTCSKMFIQITETRIYTLSYVQLSYSLRAEFLIVV